MAHSSDLRNKIEKHFRSNNVAMTGYVYQIPLNKQPRITILKNI